MRITVDIPDEALAAAIKLFHLKKLCGETEEDIATNEIEAIALEVCVEAQKQWKQARKGKG